MVSERLMLSLCHGNNLLLKPGKQISYGKDISRCHYGVIRRNISLQQAGRRGQCVCVCVSACVCVIISVHLIMFYVVQILIYICVKFYLNIKAQ